MYCVILPTSKVSIFFTFVNLQKNTNTVNLLTNPNCEIHTLFQLSHCNFFFYFQINTYLLLIYLHIANKTL